MLSRPGEIPKSGGGVESQDSRRQLRGKSSQGTSREVLARLRSRGSAARPRRGRRRPGPRAVPGRGQPERPQPCRSGGSHFRAEISDLPRLQAQGCILLARGGIRRKIGKARMRPASEDLGMEDRSTEIGLDRSPAISRVSRPPILKTVCFSSGIDLCDAPQILHTPVHSSKATQNNCGRRSNTPPRTTRRRRISGAMRLMSGESSEVRLAKVP